MDAVKEYLAGVGPLLTAAGGAPVKRLKVDDVVKGAGRGMVLVMDFDSADQVHSMFESEEYAALVPVRDRGFAEMDILVTSSM